MVIFMDKQITINDLEKSLLDYSQNAQELAKTIPDKDTQIAFDELSKATFYMFDNIITYIKNN